MIKFARYKHDGTDTTNRVDNVLFERQLKECGIPEMLLRYGHCGIGKLNDIPKLYKNLPKIIFKGVNK
ncbi:MAG: hypothetical protein IMZ53_11395 [Thermoplasmata archaeon]|nr:hypothetical protein [Thermoplasmata archaeon]